MQEPQSTPARPRLATVWLGGCSGCHMSFLDLDEALVDLLQNVDLVYGPLVDAKEYPEQVDICLVEGAVTNLDNLELIRQIRRRTRLLVSFGDCALTGNVTSMRNRIPVDDLLTAVYHEASAPVGAEAIRQVPALLPRVLPVHQVVHIDARLPGCPPDVDRIAALVSALLDGQNVELEPRMRTFG